MVKFSLIPREERFFGLFEASAQNMVKTAEGLKDMIDHWEHLEGKMGEITEYEHEGDTITHRIMARLHRTFVTPFDREDIALLAHTIDDITDFIEDAAIAMFTYKVDQPGERAKELADVIVQQASEIAKAMPLLRKRSDLKNILKHCVEINRLENMGDKAFRSAMAELFEVSTDMAYIIKWREIYKHMEAATDRCEDVADVLEGVALRHA